MDLRPYVVVVEIHPGGGAAGHCEIRLIDAFKVEEACQQAIIETFGRYHLYDGGTVHIVFVAPQTVRNLSAAVNIVRDLPMIRMIPVGMIQ